MMWPLRKRTPRRSSARRKASMPERRPTYSSRSTPGRTPSPRAPFILKRGEYSSASGSGRDPEVMLWKGASSVRRSSMPAGPAAAAVVLAVAALQVAEVTWSDEAESKASPRPGAHALKDLTPAERLAYLRRAQIWHRVDV